MKEKYYPESKVEIRGFVARNYDIIMNIISFGIYGNFISAAVKAMEIKSGEAILDLGCGTGRNGELMLQHAGETGTLTGVDIAEEMEIQFKKRFAGDARAEYLSMRIDQPFKLEKEYDRAFMAFVLHGFPHEVRLQIIKNIYDNLKPGGLFSLLDFGEFSLKEMPLLYRVPFTTIECDYAFDFIEKNWKEILADHGLQNPREYFFMKKYIRLLTVQKS